MNVLCAKLQGPVYTYTRSLVSYVCVRAMGYVFSINVRNQYFCES